MLTQLIQLFIYIYVLCSSLPGAPLKVCPQGFSCCTVEMEEKLSQQSHMDMNAPVTRLSTNLQIVFRQKHENFDSKQTHGCTPAAFQLHCAVTALVWCLTDAPTCQCRDSRSVFAAPPPVSQRLSSLPYCPPQPASLPFSRDMHTSRRTTHIFRFCLLCTSCSSMCVCL